MYGALRILVWKKASCMIVVNHHTKREIGKGGEGGKRADVDMGSGHGLST